MVYIREFILNNPDILKQLNEYSKIIIYKDDTDLNMVLDLYNNIKKVLSENELIYEVDMSMNMYVGYCEKSPNYGARIPLTELNRIASITNILK